MLPAVTDPQGPAGIKPTLPLAAVPSAIGSANRWASLRILASGNQVAVVEMAEQLGVTPTAVSKQMAVLIERSASRAAPISHRGCA
jgi:predicted transcriptional regulator